ncbi:MAG: hypothetical protein ABEI98_08665 [Halorhabdus sp.]
MTTEYTYYGKIEEALLAVGLGLVLLGAVVIGFFETVLGSAHFTQRIPGLGVVIVHTSFTPHLRASVIALGFLVLFGWSCYRVGRAILN